MDCPICNYPGVSEEATTCPRCDSDLSVFHEIHSMSGEIKGSKSFNKVLYIIITVLVLGWAYTYFFAGTLKDNEMKDDSNQKTKQIIELNREISRLKNLVVDKTGTTKYQPDDATTYKNPTAEAIRKQSLVNARKMDNKPVKTNTNKPKVTNNNTTKTNKQNNTISYHTVRTGETLYSIAKKVYGNGSKYKKIMSDNNIVDHTDIKVGQKLKIYPN